MFKKVAVAIDGSQASSRALAVAVDVAKHYGAHLTILHAVMVDASLMDLLQVAERHGFKDLIAEDVDAAANVTAVPVPVTAAPFLVTPEELLDKVGNLLLEASAAEARSLGVDEVATALLSEDPAHELPAFVKANGIDLIVCGTRGLGEIKSFFLGSVSHKLLEEAACPCLVVK
jgi:nucleotide-binding universal stress UspA family protein